jgi:hypothetical protein
MIILPLTSDTVIVLPISECHTLHPGSVHLQPDLDISVDVTILGLIRQKG